METNRAERVLEFIRATAGDVTKETSVNDLELDSLEFIDLLQGLENSFEVQFSNEEMQGFETVGDIADAVDRKQN